VRASRVAPATHLPDGQDGSTVYGAQECHVKARERLFDVTEARRVQFGRAKSYLGAGAQDTPPKRC